MFAERFVQAIVSRERALQPGGTRLFLTYPLLRSRSSSLLCPAVSHTHLHCLQEHLVLVTELLRANLYEFQK